MATELDTPNAGLTAESVPMASSDVNHFPACENKPGRVCLSSRRLHCALRLGRVKSDLRVPLVGRYGVNLVVRTEQWAVLLMSRLGADFIWIPDRGRAWLGGRTLRAAWDEVLISSPHKRVQIQSQASTSPFQCTQASYDGTWHIVSSVETLATAMIGQLPSGPFVSSRYPHQGTLRLGGLG